jgi:UDP-2,4-diacetamido-2,4,6-trideoxy-beta-L-altropyranose hydrolase
MNEKVTVRKAIPQDVAAIFELSNQPSVRDSSFNSAPIDWMHHIRWFSAATTDPNCGFYVAEIGAVLAGQLRFNRKGDEAVVSISIDPRFRGKGIGAALYRHGLADFRLRHPMLKITAKIKKRNEQSIAFFQHLGFVDSSCERINDEEAVIMVDYQLSPEVEP